MNSYLPACTNSRILLFGLVCLPVLSSVAATNEVSMQHVPAHAWETFKQPGSFIVSLAQDKQSNIWIGTEGAGIFCYNPLAETNQQWTQFTVTNGLGDNYAYALACDQQGRIWAGHLNHGVSVFNGSTWQNYDVLNGPIGERVFRIAVCPTDGDVWMATSAGLTRYSVNKDSWTYYTRADGLPSDQANALAFDKRGNLYVGTQCDGIVIASGSTDYRQWRVVSAPDKLPISCKGFGLPTKQINDILVSSKGTVFAATSAGLACSTNQGESWDYIRGRNYADKVRGLTGGPPKKWEEADKQAMAGLLSEDYVTCLAEDLKGLLWLGFREHGFVALDIESYKPVVKASFKRLDLVSAILPSDGSNIFWGGYRGGFLISSGLSHNRRNRSSSDHGANFQPPISYEPAVFPTPARPPSLAELNGMLQEVSTVASLGVVDQPTVIPLEDDWQTEGKWLGRYGRFWSVLCANWSPHDDIWGAGWDVSYDARIGFNHAPNDSMRYWVHWLATKDNRALEMSPTYMDSRVEKHLTTWDVDRRQSEWDDGGEKYPMTKDGPHIYLSLKVPPGLFYLSLYDDNKDGQSAFHGRFRDYYISIRPHSGRESMDSSGVMRSFYDIENFDLEPELAHARIENFWPGVYKRFLVRGPATLTVQIKRNYSFNTILAGAMLDLVDEFPPPYYQSRREWERKQSLQNVESPKTMLEGPAFSPATTSDGAAKCLFETLQRLSFKNEVWWAINKRRFYLPLARLYLRQERNMSPKENISEQTASCYYQIGLYPQWEEELKHFGITPTRDIEKSLRWDGVTYSSAGKEYEIVSRYLESNPATVKNQH